MKAFVLAGGFGTRLRPITYAIPKPLLPYKEKPLLYHIIMKLKKAGITDIILSTGYLSYQIEYYFGNGRKFGVKITYAKEKEPMGTAGSLNLVRNKLKETFLLVGGDNYTDLDFRKFIKFHKEKKSLCTVALFDYREKALWGIYTLNRNGSVNTFKEKPSFRHLAGTMIFACEPEIFDYIPKKKGIINITDHIIPKLLEKGKSVYGYPFKDRWIDIGSMEDYQRLIDE